jgi:hypothetical protein
MDHAITRSRGAVALTFVVGLLGASTLLTVYPSPAPASGRACHPSIYNCVEVLGGGLRVDKAKGRTAMVYSTKTKVYHFELWAGRWHHNTPDQVWEGTIRPGYVDSGWVSVKRSFPNGTGVCSRLWVKLDGRWTSPDGMSCLKLTR